MTMLFVNTAGAALGPMGGQRRVGILGDIALFWFLVVTMVVYSPWSV